MSTWWIILGVAIVAFIALYNLLKNFSAIDLFSLAFIILLAYFGYKLIRWAKAETNG